VADAKWFAPLRGAHFFDARLQRTPKKGRGVIYRIQSRGG
jgi:hypothetical protein